MAATAKAILKSPAIKPLTKCKPWAASRSRCGSFSALQRICKHFRAGKPREREGKIQEGGIGAVKRGRLFCDRIANFH
jgi:hypothetical protein